MKKLFFSIACLALLIMACDKNAKVVKNLEGAWTVTSITIDGVEAPSDGYSYEFTACEDVTAGCKAVIRYDNGWVATEDTITYKIEEKGTLFTTVIDNATNIADIIEHSKTTFITRYTDGADQVLETTLTKNE